MLIGEAIVDPRSNKPNGKDFQEASRRQEESARVLSSRSVRFASVIITQGIRVLVIRAKRITRAMRQQPVRDVSPRCRC